MKLSLIAAAANNNVIGRENRLIWHLPADLKHFKNLTMGHTMIMGRKTFESIGGPLKGRRTIVISRKQNYDAKGCEVAHSLEEAIKMVKTEKEVFVAGGAEIYQQAIGLKWARRIFLTRIYANFEGDAFFPEVDKDQWEIIDRTDHQPDEKNKYSYSFFTYKRKLSCHSS
jgi:dihydrofolate reductase